MLIIPNTIRWCFNHEASADPGEESCYGRWLEQAQADYQSLIGQSIDHVHDCHIRTLQVKLANRNPVQPLDTGESGVRP